MKKKTLALLLALVLVFGAAVGGTIAYLTDTTAPITNTFTVGDIGDLTLTETTGTNYTIIPGASISKDPVVAYVSDTNNDVAVYVFVKVTALDWTVAEDGMSYSKKTISADPALSFTIDNRWTYLTKDGNDYIYYASVDAATDFSASVISGNSITVSANIVDSEIETLAGTLTFAAYAIQQSGFDTAAAAWTEVKS